VPQLVRAWSSLVPYKSCEQQTLAKGAGGQELALLQLLCCRFFNDRAAKGLGTVLSPAAQHHNAFVHRAALLLRTLVRFGYFEQVRLCVCVCVCV